MITQNQNITLDEKDRNEIIDFGLRLGQVCWDVYCQSPVGFTRLFMLPSDAARRRANELFHLGFAARLIICPPTDGDTEMSDGEMMWKDYLATMDGRIVLGCVAYPDTPEFILDYAKHFFLEGFVAGTITVRELFKK